MKKTVIPWKKKYIDTEVVDEQVVDQEIDSEEESAEEEEEKKMSKKKKVALFAALTAAAVGIGVGLYNKLTGESDDGDSVDVDYGDDPETEDSEVDTEE